MLFRSQPQPQPVQPIAEAVPSVVEQPIKQLVAPKKQLDKPKVPDYKYNPVSKLPLVLKVENMETIPESFHTCSIIPIFQIAKFEPRETLAPSDKLKQLESAFGFRKDFGENITNWLFDNMCNSTDIEFAIGVKEKRVPAAQKKLFNVDDDLYNYANLGS